MSLTQLKNLTGYEVSLVPFGANKKRKFLVTKENDGELSMKKELLEQILKEGLKDEESIDKVAKSLNLSEDENKVFKAIMKMVGNESSPLSKEKLMKALGEMGVSKEDPMGDDKDKNTEKECKNEEATKEDSMDGKQVNKEGKEPAGGGNMSGKVPVRKEDGSWDLSNVDETLRPSLEVILKSSSSVEKELDDQKKVNKSLSDKLKASEDKRIMKELTEKAESFGHVGESAVSVAKVLKSAYEISEENGKTLEEILKADGEKIKEGEVFKELGTSGGASIPGGTAWDKIEKQADKLVEADSKISKSEAIDIVCKKHPELYEEYNNEKKRG